MKNICGEEWSAVLRNCVSNHQPDHLSAALEKQPNTAPAALHYAVEYNNIECLKIALQHCGKRWRHIHKALTQAADFNSLPMVRILAPLLRKSQNSNTAFAFACRHENTDMMEVLWNTSTPEDVLEKFKVMGMQKSRVDLLSNFISDKHARQQKKILQECVTTTSNTSIRKNKI